MPPSRPLNHAHLARAAITSAREDIQVATMHPDSSDSDVRAICAVASSGVAIANALLLIREDLVAHLRAAPQSPPGA